MGRFAVYLYNLNFDLYDGFCLIYLYGSLRLQAFCTRPQFQLTRSNILKQNTMWSLSFCQASDMVEVQEEEEVDEKNLFVGSFRKGRNYRGFFINILLKLRAYLEKCQPGQERFPHGEDFNQKEGHINHHQKRSNINYGIARWRHDIISEKNIF